MKMDSLKASQLRVVLPFICLTLAVSESVSAANWLALQGTEPKDAARARLWGFVQPQWQQTSGSDLPAGPFAGQDAVFNQITPNLRRDRQFQFRRARLGVRGNALPRGDEINYFFLVEAGKNGITEISTDKPVALTDASVTLNYFRRFTRLRLGQFKYPGSEDGLQAIHAHNYIDFATPANQLLLERFFKSDGTPALNENEPDQFSAYRDIGVQLFNWFNYGSWQGRPWELSYAFMIGNGNGIDTTESDGNKDVYLYTSAGQIFDGKGPLRQDWKAFAWYQDGKRDLKVGSTQNENSYDRTRWGLGLTYRRNKYRLYAEYYWADGMIFNGTDGGAVPGSFNNAETAVASFNISPNQESDGGYIDFGYKLLPQLELDYRFSYLDRATNSPDAQEREFWDHTFGAQFFFYKQSRVVLNYQIREARAPDFNSSAVPNQVLDKLDNLLSLQLLAIF